MGEPAVEAEVYLGYYIEKQLKAQNNQGPFSSWAKVEKPRLLVFNYYLGTTDGKRPSYKDGRITLVVDDDNKFWPSIVRLSDEAAEKLARQLLAAIEERKAGSDKQLQGVVE